MFTKIKCKGLKSVILILAVLILSVGSVVFLTFDDRSATAKGYTGFKNITLRNFTVNCKNGGTYYGSGLMNAAHGEGLIVDNVTVKDGLAGHSFQLTGMKNVKISNCTFQNLTRVYEEEGTGADKTRVLKNYTRSYLNKNGIKEFGNGSNKNPKNVILTHEVIQIETDFSDVKNSNDICKNTYACPTCKMSNDNTACIDVTISACTFSNVIRALENHTSRGAGC